MLILQFSSVNKELKKHLYKNFFIGQRKLIYPKKKLSSYSIDLKKISVKVKAETTIKQLKSVPR